MVNVAVIGAGYLGRFHIEKFAAMQDCKLAGVVEVVPAVREEIKQKYNVPVYAEYTDARLLSKLDAVSVVVPTPHHHTVAGFFIDKGIHTFIEKPATETYSQCMDLIKRQRSGTKVQVGHIERFNPAYQTVRNGVKRPRSVQSRRKAPFNIRGSDVDVVYDVMIHDIDLVLSMFPGVEPQDLKAVGIKAVTRMNDYISASWSMGDVSIKMEASRLHYSKERMMTVLEDGAVWEGDFITQEVYVKTADQEKILRGEKVDSLYMELSAFIRAVKDGTATAVTLEDGYRAIKLASDIIVQTLRTDKQ